MNQDDKKRQVAEAALGFVSDHAIIGVGTGSTANFLIDLLSVHKSRIKGAVASSEATAARLQAYGIRVYDLNDVGELEVYLDGADEATEQRHLIKGGGGALTREKIVAAASRYFVCLIDDSKLVSRLGRFPLPVEVIPMARSFVARQLVKLGGQPAWRSATTTDNGNFILDVHDLDLADPPRIETAINQIPGVVTNGLFALRGADILLVGIADGVRQIS